MIPVAPLVRRINKDTNRRPRLITNSELSRENIQYRISAVKEQKLRLTEINDLTEEVKRLEQKHKVLCPVHVQRDVAWSADKMGQ